ncbi:hypothetical protein F0P96_10430 [Hymenobacter busanensis]|uniref:Uncharacterized protein n=1 Tax=Hymenobacter busanensis TaxID=2607656 RepID=A0A7L4ZWS7_9BACT|nr:hypothetical protein [Hymenobacter busanensis]KAA9333376.1 hypothetical protein F0P96_10430 [Hymenobacter busanensis]QHJ07944.1 hypothetical protein GUY19_11875 [Hymenobacter busanensis]
METQQAIKERPILFSAPMVRAILSGAKTQTRRIVKPQPSLSIEAVKPEWAAEWIESIGKQFVVNRGLWKHDFPKASLLAHEFVACPYGQPGDRLYVRETWACPKQLGGSFVREKAKYRADYEDFATVAVGAMGGWKPSIHMPRTLSRLLLEIVSVRVERLMDISEEDAKAEGVNLVHVNKKGGQEWENYLDDWAFEYFAKDSYATLWEKINGLGSWATNPWVWVVEFKRVEA